VKYNTKINFKFNFFSDSPTAMTRGIILTANGSQVAFSRKDGVASV